MTNSLASIILVGYPASALGKPAQQHTAKIDSLTSRERAPHRVGAMA
jgi:hypothetical protein